MQQLVDILSGFGNSIVAFLILLSIIVVIHELGHYYAGRVFGMSIDCFSLGFGPQLFSYRDKRGVIWRMAAIPLGGYVKFTGDQDATSFSSEVTTPANEEQKSWFQFSPLWQRAIVIAAGPIANFLLAIFIFSLTFMIIGKTILLPYVDEVVEGGAAERAGLQKNDLILKVDQDDVNSFEDLQRIVNVSAGKTLTFEIKRDNAIIQKQITPETVEIEDPLGAPIRLGRIGISRTASPETVKTVELGVFESMVEGVKETGYLIKRTYQFLLELITGKQSVKQLGGPVKIAEVSGMAAENGILSFVSMIALISISVGFFNLLPIPPLDGGHLIFYAVEAIIRKPVNDQFKEYGFKIGFAFLLTFMLFATWNDISSLYSRFIGG